MDGRNEENDGDSDTESPSSSCVDDEGKANGEDYPVSSSSSSSNAAIGSRVFGMIKNSFKINIQDDVPCRDEPSDDYQRSRPSR